MAYGTTISIAGAAPSLPAYGTPVNIVDPVTGAAIVPISNPFVGQVAVSDTVAYSAAQNGGTLLLTHTSTSTSSGGTFGSVGAIANGDYALAIDVEYNPPSASSNLLFAILSQVNVSGTAQNTGFIDNAWHGVNYNSTGNLTAAGGIWVGEFSGANMNSATVAALTACEFNVMNGCDATFKSIGGSGTVTNAYAVRIVIAPYGTATTGFTNAYGVYIEASDTVNDTQLVTNRWGIIVKKQNNSPSGTSTTGGFVARGIEVRGSTQGGNTDGGTNENSALYVSGGGGNAGTNSTINNYAINVATFTGGTSTGGTSVANNWGLFINTMSVVAANTWGIQVKRHGAAAGSLAGAANYGIQTEISIGGGNATGTVNNYGLNSTMVGTAGTSGSGGNVNNYGIYTDVPTGALGTGGSVVNNYGLRISGNGGTATSWALYSSSTSNSSILGSLAVGSNTAAASGVGLAVTSTTIAQVNVATFTNTGAVTDGYLTSQRHTPTYDGAFTVTRHNYFDLNNPLLTNSAVLTDAAVFRFDAAPGTHKALAADAAVAVTFTALGPTGAQTTIQGWLKINVNGTLRYIPFW